MKINSFAFGLMAGIGIGYLLSSHDQEEIVEGVENAAKTAKKVVNEGMKKGKKMASAMKERAEDWE